jgi:large subunit ribosomal protein LP0
MSLNRNEERAQKGMTGIQRSYPARKKEFGEKLVNMMENSQKILVMNADHIGSRKLSELRKQFRGRARFLFGKNTLIRKMLRNYMRQTGRTEISSLLPTLRSNCCLVFLEHAREMSVFDMVKLQNEIVAASRVTCVPRAGVIAPCDVVIKPMSTGLEPTRTSFFAAMNIATRIFRGQIEIVNRVLLIRRGERVGPSEAALLHVLGLKPFSYAMEPVAVYWDGECYPGRDGLDDKLFNVGYPNMLTVPDSISLAYRRMMAAAVGLCQDYSLPGLDEIRNGAQNGVGVMDDDDDDDGGGGDFLFREETPPPESLSEKPFETVFDSDSDSSDTDSE